VRDIDGYTLRATPPYPKKVQGLIDRKIQELKNQRKKSKALNE